VKESTSRAEEHLARDPPQQNDQKFF